jgi:hypothetical protein
MALERRPTLSHTLMVKISKITNIKEYGYVVVANINIMLLFGFYMILQFRAVLIITVSTFANRLIFV